MSSVDSHLDEFESVFRASVRPHVEIEPLALERLLVVLDSEGSDLKREAVIACATDMADRFKVETRVLVPLPRLKREGEPDVTRASRLLRRTLEGIEGTGLREFSGEVKVGPSARIILNEVAACEPSMLLMSSLFGHDDDELESYTLGSVADRVLSSVAQPIMLIEGGVQDPARLWSDMLIFVDAAATAGSCLSAALTLADKGARTSLLHVLDGAWLATVKRGIELASELESDKAVEAICRSLVTDMKNYLSAAVEALTHTGHVASSNVEIGDPIELTRQAITSGNHGLLVCNSVAPDQKLIDSIAYNLAAYLRDIPLLLV